MVLGWRWHVRVVSGSKGLMLGRSIGRGRQGSEVRVRAVRGRPRRTARFGATGARERGLRVVLGVSSGSREERRGGRVRRWVARPVGDGLLHRAARRHGDRSRAP